MLFPTLWREFLPFGRITKLTFEWGRTVASKSSIGGYTFVLEGLPFVQRGLTLNLTKIYRFIMFHILIWGTWSFVWWDKPTKAPSGDGTGWEIDERNLKIINLTTFILKEYKIGETKTTAQTTSDLLPKHQASQSSLKTSEVATLLLIIHVCTLERSPLCDVLTIHQSTVLLVQISG